MGHTVRSRPFAGCVTPVTATPPRAPSFADHAAAAASGLRIEDGDVERLSPLETDHITLTGRYRIAQAEALREHGA
jgi:hypothetical protein